jgi:hypothetical protein
MSEFTLPHSAKQILLNQLEVSILTGMCKGMTSRKLAIVLHKNCSVINTVIVGLFQKFEIHRTTNRDELLRNFRTLLAAGSNRNFP